VSRSPFVRSLAFALAAAAALLVGAPLLAPAFGERAGVRFLLVAAVVAHVALLAPSRSRSARAAALAAGGSALVLALPLGVGATALTAAALLGVCRSAILFRARPARAALLEGALLGGGLALAAFLAGPWLARIALAVWGFWLVQSAFFAVGGVAPRPEPPGNNDPFERARAQVLALLD
jgi:hypothetical protein